MKSSEPATNQRILASAREVFLEKGFRSATVREIAVRAKANIASIHYHFQDKETLYLTVIDDFLAGLFDKYPANNGKERSLPPEQRLAAFVRSFMLRIYMGAKTSEDKTMIRLAAREFSSPSTPLPLLADRRISPMVVTLHEIIDALLGLETPKRIKALCVSAVWGQCMHHAHFATPVTAGVLPDNPSQDEVEALADDISCFSLSGIQGILNKYGISPSHGVPWTAQAMGAGTETGHLEKGSHKPESSLPGHRQ